jgi:hypothetical protein
MATGGEVRTVELIQAFLWTCEDCGRDNFERGITISPESIDPEDPPDTPGADPDTIRDWLEAGGEGGFVVAPDQVKCRHCGSEFGTSEV